MTDQQFESLVEAMLDDAAPDLQTELRQFCVDEVFKIAPLIDNMVVQARLDGEFETYLRICAAQQKKLRRPNINETWTPF